VISFEGAPALEAILVDVTERRKIQDQMVAYERLRALGEMAGGVAHDFNNVLGAILARAQMLQRYSPDEKIMRGLQIIEKAAKDGAETVKRIQNFTRVRTEQDFAPLRLNPVLEDVLEMTRGRWEDEAHRQGKAIQVVRELGEVPLVKGNISELRETFTNFIFNAVDAIPRAGTITVKTWTESDRVVVTFSDTGEGMSPEVQRKLFDPFFTTKGAGGTGLGLSVAYGIARRHGASIDVRSERGKGTTFRLEFPALRAKDAAADEVPAGIPPAAPSSVGTERVLVVDDQNEIRDLVRDVLQGAGYVVTMARDGAEALERIQAQAFDLVITDLGMPGISGWEVARESRRMRPEVRIILLTGWAATLDLKDIEKNGVNRTLKKPFEMDGLLRTVRDVLGPAGLSRAA
jgi:CheY-like chemotaxis protein